MSTENQIIIINLLEKMNESLSLIHKELVTSNNKPPFKAPNIMDLFGGMNKNSMNVNEEEDDDNDNDDEDDSDDDENENEDEDEDKKITI